MSGNFASTQVQDKKAGSRTIQVHNRNRLEQTDKSTQMASRLLLIYSIIRLEQLSSWIKKSYSATKGYVRDTHLKARVVEGGLLKDSPENLSASTQRRKLYRIFNFH